MTNATQIQKAINLYHSGSPLWKVGKALGTGSRGARKVLVQHGVTIRNTGRPKTDTLAGKTFDEIKQMHLSGMTLYDISDTLNMSTTAIRHFLVKNGYETSRRNLPVSAERQTLINQVIRLRDSSVTYQVIAEVLGISRSTVQRIASSN